MKKLVILLLAVFLAICVGIGIAQMNKGDLINKQTETLDNSRKTVRGQDIMTPSTKGQQGRVLTDSDHGVVPETTKGHADEIDVLAATPPSKMPGDEIMVIIYPSPPAFDPSPEYRFGDGIRGTRLPSEMNKADLIESLSTKIPPKGYRYVFGFTPKEDGPFVVYSTRNGTITAMMKKGDRKPKGYDHEGLAISDVGPQTTGGNGGTTCWRCYEIDGELHCFEVDCPFIKAPGGDEGASVSPEVLRTVVPKDPGSTLPPSSTVPYDPGRSTSTTTTDPGRGSQQGSSDSSTIIKRGGD